MNLDQVRSTIDQVFAEHVAAEPAPGLVYGVVLGDELVHAGAFGELRRGDGTLPDADSVFRIASMTKSFTAALLLMLRDEGRLRLDDSVRDYVPQLRGDGADPRVTLRHLLTMTAGFPTDDPWGDRQQPLDYDAFTALLESGPTLIWRPGEAYEYSNLGYALLGRAIEQVTGQPYRDVVQHRILDPLGLTSTGFDAEAWPVARVATGYVRRGDDWVAEAHAGYGAFAPMGGLFSSVRDLATWVSGFLGAEPGGQTGHPVDPASLREMQLTTRLVDADLSQPGPEGMPELRVRGYGFGLVEEFFPEGRTVGHSGGYPGFGSHMRWHPESRLAVVALANRTYAPMTKVATRALREAVRAAAPSTSRRPLPAWNRMDAARRVVMSLLEAWDDDLVAAWFTQSMAEDEPLDQRRTWLEEVRRRHGRLTESGECPEPTSPTTPAVGCWWLAGERGGRVRVEVMLSPHRAPRIQWLAVTSVPEPAGELVAAAQSAVAAGADHPWWTGARLGPVSGGDGTTRATFAVVDACRPAEVEVTAVAGQSPVARLRLLPVRADIR